MGERKKILIVDDERFNINVLADLLKPNYKIMVAINGKQALKAAQSDSPPDLILLDVMMPEMDGHEVCQQLKADEKTREIPLIFVTAMGQESDETKGLEMGAVDYITKPISPAIVEARVRVQIERKEAEEAVAAAHARIQLLKKIAVAANEASVVEDAMQVCLDEVCALTGWPVGHLYVLAADGTGELVTAKRWHLDNPRKFKTFQQVTEKTRFASGIGLPGRVLQSGKPAWISDVTKDPNYPRAKLAEDIGVKAAFCFPVLVGSEVAAVLEFYTSEVVEPNDQLLEVMVQVGTQLGRVIERKAAEEALAASHARINHIVASSPAVLYTFEARGDYAPTFISENVRDVFGYEPSEYLEDPKFVPERIHPDDAARVRAALSELFASGHLTHEYRFRRKDGSYCWVSDELRVIRDEDGAPLEVVGSWSDISAKKNVEESLVDLLGATSLFGSLDAAVLRDIAAESKHIRLSGGEILMKQGEAPDSFYLVISGRLRTFVSSQDGVERVVNERGRGDLVGETSVLTGEPRRVTARAIRDSELLQFSKEGLYRFIERQPQVVVLLSKSIAVRYEKEVQGIRANPAISTIAVLPAGDGATLSDFTKRLSVALSAIGPTICLDAQQVSQKFGEEGVQKEGSGKDRVMGWLNSLESEYRFILYESTLEPSAWTRRCIRQADRILLVGRAGNDPRLNAIEEELRISQSARPIARQELVLLHASRERQPSGTKNWLEQRTVADHHHIVLDNTDDYERLSRFITGQAIGLVLGGGGARGCAHIGLVRAMREQGIPIDVVGGVSIGAIIAAGVARGLVPDEMLHTIETLWITKHPFGDYTLPIVSIIKGRRMDKLLREMYRGIQIEDLWIKYFSVSSNLTRAKMEVHQDGDLWQWVRATISLPGFFPPVVINGELYVDGGVLNNLPVDVMRNICDGRVIAQNVSPRVDLTVTGDSEAKDSRRGLLRTLFDQGSSEKNLPNILKILVRSGTLSSVNAVSVAENMADIYLNPPVGGYEILDLKPVREIEEVGYRHARDILKDQASSWL
jgi:PAS domain S-box-containing protein